MMIYTIDNHRAWASLLAEWHISNVKTYHGVAALQKNDFIIVHVSDCSDPTRQKLIEKSEELAMRFIVVTGGDALPNSEWEEAKVALKGICLTHVPYFQEMSDLDDQQQQHLHEIMTEALEPLNDPPCSMGVLRLRSSVGNLTAVIHSLQNLFLPVKLDSETLKETSESHNPDTVRGVFDDHFGSGKLAYLSDDSIQHEGRDILHRLNTLCALLETHVLSSIADERDAIIETVHATRTYAKAISEENGLPQSRELQAWLQMIADACDALVDALREIRRKKQEDG